MNEPDYISLEDESGNAEHQLKSSLTTIIGWSDLLFEQWTTLGDSEREKALEAIRNASLKANTQLDSLLGNNKTLIVEPIVEIKPG